MQALEALRRLKSAENGRGQQPRVYLERRIEERSKNNAVVWRSVEVGVGFFYWYWDG